MPNLSAVLDREAGTVTLTVDDTRNVKAILRTDANGTRPVRMGEGSQTLPGISDGKWVDYEAALGGYVSYRLDHPSFRDLVWVNLSGDWAPRFIIPFTPMFYAEAEVVTAYDSARKSTATFHDVIGRTDPLVVEGRLSSRKGRLVCEFDTLAAASGLESLLSRGTTVLYRQSEHPGMDMYFHTEGMDVSVDAERNVWTVTVDYVEVSFPAGDIISTAGWDFTAVTAAYSNFTELSTSYDSFLSLTLAEEKTDEG